MGRSHFQFLCSHASHVSKLASPDIAGPLSGTSRFDTFHIQGYCQADNVSSFSVVMEVVRMWQPRSLVQLLPKVL